MKTHFKFKNMNFQLLKYMKSVWNFMKFLTVQIFLHNHFYEELIGYLYPCWRFYIIQMQLLILC